MPARFVNKVTVVDTFDKSIKQFSNSQINEYKKNILRFLKTATIPVSNYKLLYNRFINLASNNKIQQIQKFNYTTPTCKEVIISVMQNLELSRAQLAVDKTLSTPYSSKLKKFGILISSIKCKSIFSKLKYPLEADNIKSMLLDKHLFIIYKLTENETVDIIYDPLKSLVGFVYENATL